MDREVIDTPGFPHGETRGYRAGCACFECRNAARLYELNRRKQIAYGRWPLEQKVDTEPIREHLVNLREKGMTAKPVEFVTGIHANTVWRITEGKYWDRVGKETADKLMAVRFDADILPPSTRVPAHGALRRGRALLAFGYPYAWQCEQMGVFRHTFANMARTGGCYAFVWRASRDLYAKYASIPAPDSRLAKLSRNRAARLGYPNPYQWDDDLLDLADEELQAELSRRARQMSDAETQRCSIAARDGDISPLILAGKDEYQRRKIAARRAKYLREKERSE